MLSRSYRYQLWKLQRELRAVREKVAKVLKDAETKKGSRLEEHEHHEITAEYGWEFDVIECSISEFRTEWLRNEADLLFVGLPPHSDEDKWERNAMGNYVLTVEGIREVTSKIRKEKLDRLEPLRQKITIVGTFVAILTGLLGALIGLLAILRKG